VFGTWGIKPDMWRLVFMPLAFADTKMLRAWKKNGVAHVYGIVGEDTTAQRAINGYPMFADCHVITERDFLKLRIAANMAKRMRERFVSGT